MIRQKFIIPTVALLLTLTITACVSIKRVEQLEVSKDGLKIEEISGKFKFDGQSVYYPPTAQACMSRGTPENISLFGDRSMGAIGIEFFADVKHVEKVVDIGHKIVITKPGFTERYGILLLCEINPQCAAGKPQGSGVEKHYIKIDDSAFDLTKDGEIAVLYDSVSIPQCQPSFDYPTWLIWMSDEIFW